MLGLAPDDSVLVAVVVCVVLIRVDSGVAVLVNVIVADGDTPIDEATEADGSEDVVAVMDCVSAADTPADALAVASELVLIVGTGVAGTLADTVALGEPDMVALDVIDGVGADVPV